LQRFGFHSELRRKVITSGVRPGRNGRQKQRISLHRAALPHQLDCQSDVQCL
jgi:hypothetical protein